MWISHKPPRVISVPIMDDIFLWDFVDCASQGRPQIGGDGGIIHLSSTRSIHFAVGWGDASNNQVEFVVFNILLRISLALGVDKL